MEWEILDFHFVPKYATVEIKRLSDKSVLRCRHKSIVYESKKWCVSSPLQEVAKDLINEMKTYLECNRHLVEMRYKRNE